MTHRTVSVKPCLTFIDYSLCAYAIFVVGLGAYTRLTDSGLGCPDWPKCYGYWLVHAQAVQPSLTPEFTLKAWIEMIHRFAAGGLAIIASSWLGYKVYRQQLQWWQLAPLIVLFTIQALFGMITVTWKLHPLAVMPHLMGGMLATCFIYYLLIRSKPQAFTQALGWPLRLLIIALWLQVMLGGWTSANYAALICPDFPTCQGQWVPDHINLWNVFQWLPIGPNYETGGYSALVRRSIHWLHRLGAVVVLTLWLWTLWYVWTVFRKKSPVWWPQFQQLSLLLMLQVALGICNIVYQLPLWVAVAHNVTALLLLLKATELWTLSPATPFLHSSISVCRPSH